MNKLRFMLWLATVLPFSWWAWAWWKIYFQKRVYYVGTFGGKQDEPRS